MIPPEQFDPLVPMTHCKVLLTPVMCCPRDGLYFVGYIGFVLLSLSDLVGADKNIGIISASEETSLFLFLFSLSWLTVFTCADSGRFYSCLNRRLSFLSFL